MSKSQKCKGGGSGIILLSLEILMFTGNMQQWAGESDRVFVFFTGAAMRA